jgi:hypothetical protein
VSLPPTARPQLDETQVQVTAVARTRRVLGVRSRLLPRLLIDGAVLCDYDGLDRAGRWCDCPRPSCPHAAYLVDLFPSVDAARSAARERAERFAQENIPSHRADLLRTHRLYVRRLNGDQARGHDYRRTGCGIPNATDELRSGNGDEPAWKEIKRQRRDEGADGALLRSAKTPNGLLFLYASALELLDLSEVIDEIVYPFR